MVQKISPALLSPYLNINKIKALITFKMGAFYQKFILD